MRTPLFIAAIVVTACAWLSTWTPGDAAAADPKETGPGIRFHAGTSARDIPFRYEMGHIILTVRIADSLEVDMLLDTGLGVDGAILLDPAIGEALGLRYSGKVPLGGGGTSKSSVADLASGITLSLPGVTFTGQTLFVVSDPEPYRGYPGRGIIGRTVFHHPVEIDYETGHIQLHDSESYRPREGSLPLETDQTHGIPVIEAKMSMDGSPDLPVKLMVDTGAVQLLLFTWADQGIRVPANVIAGRDRILARGFTGTVLGSTGRIARLQIGPYLLRQVITSFPDSATWGSALVLGQHGMLGNEELRRFLVTFDYPHNRIYLKPNDRLGDPFEADMTGLTWEPDAQGAMAVIDVIPGSPAADVAVNQGDVIVALNQVPVKELGWTEIEKLFTREGVTIHLSIQRGAQRLENTILTRRLI